jgi:hypothetical protein
MARLYTAGTIMRNAIHAAEVDRAIQPKKSEATQPQEGTLSTPKTRYERLGDLFSRFDGFLKVGEDRLKNAGFDIRLQGPDVDEFYLDVLVDLCK